jgi:outer membrane immunogenic protein
MKYGITAALLLAGLAAAAGANAQENEAGLYAGAGVGTFDVEIDTLDDIDETIDRYKSDDTAWKAFVGYRTNPYFAVELAYVNLGSPDDEILPDTTLTVETDGFAPYVVGTFPIGDWFEVFGKAGYYWYDVETRISSPVGDVSDSDGDSTFTWSAGVGAELFDRVNLRLEYEQFDFDAADDAKALWLTGGYRF